MKIFAVFAKVELTKNPEWLDAFRKKYHDEYQSHVTLKQMCFIEDDQIPDVKARVSEAMRDSIVPEHVIRVVFDQLKDFDIKNSDTGLCVPIFADANEKLHALQKRICVSLKSYTRYFEKELKQYEEHFSPHITIGDGLTAEQYFQAIRELREHGDYACEGSIREVVLSVIPEFTAKEAKNENNWTTYTL